MKKNLFWISIACTIIALANLIAYTILAKNNVVEMRTLSYIFILGFVVCAWIPFFLHLIFKLTLPLTVVLSYQVFLALSLIVGSLWRVYGMWEPFDSVVHFGSGILISLIGYALYQNSKKSTLSLVWLFVLVFAVGVMGAGIWEIYEFVSDGLIGNNAQIFEGLVGRQALSDTMIDIICGTGGSVVGACISVGLEKHKRAHTKVESTQ